MDPTSLRLMQGASGVSVGGPIEYVNDASASNAATSNLTINKPTGTQNGDLLIAVCAANNNLTWTGDTGWTEVVDQGTRPNVRVAYLVAGASEPSTYTFTLSTSTATSGVIVAFRKAAYDTIGTIVTTQSGGVQTASEITLSQSESALLAFFAVETPSETWSNPTSGLVEVKNDSNSDRPSWILYRQLNLSSGATGSRSATCSTSASGSYGCVLVGIKPA